MDRIYNHGTVVFITPLMLLTIAPLPLVKMKSPRPPVKTMVTQQWGTPFADAVINEHLTSYLECFMARITAIKNVLSPSSETMVTETEAAKA